jgi:lysophospholipase L1-like esterase
VREPRDRTAGLLQKLKQSDPWRFIVYGTSLSVERTLPWRSSGGSWVEGLSARLDELYPGLVTVTNRSRWGADSNWAVRRLRRRVLAKRPDIVLLEFGVNDADVRRGISAERFRENLDLLVGRIDQADGGCQHALMTMNPVNGKHRRHRPQLEDYYQVCRDVAESREKVLIDLYSIWGRVLKADPPAESRYIPDGIHPNRAAAREVIVPAIIEMLLPGCDESQRGG